MEVRAALRWSCQERPSGNLVRVRLLRATAAASLVVALSAPPVAEAAWTRPAVVLSGDDAALLQTVVRSDGGLRAGVRSPQVALGLSDFTSADPLVVLRPPAPVVDVALARDGSGVALEAQRGAPTSVVAFDAAGSLQPPVALADVGSDAQVAISPGGAAVAVWVARAAQGFEVDAVFRDPGSGTFGAPVRAGYTTRANTLLSTGIGDSGEAVVAWQVNGFPSDVAAAVRLPGAGFSPARFVSRGADEARLAVGPGGQAILATARGAGIDVSVKAPGVDALPKAQRIDHGQGFAIGVAAAGERQLAAAWLSAPKLRDKAQVRVYQGAGPLRRVGTVGRDAIGETVGIDVDAAGNALVAWDEGLKAKRGDPTGRSHLGIAYRRAGSHFGAVTHRGPVSLDDTPEAVRLGPGGRAWVLYEAFQSGDSGGAGYRRVYVTERRP